MDIVARFDGVSLSYGAREALRCLSFELPAGEIHGFLGPNGAGKTTTIRLMMGLLAPSGGTVELFGADPCTNREVLGLVGYVPDRPFVYEKLTGWEFLALCGALRGMQPEEVMDRGLALASRMAISDRLDELTEGYSHGMRQKLCIVAAFLHAPRLVVMDEPMVGLDPMAQAELKELFREHAAGGGTVFLSTHTLSVAEQVCHKVTLLYGGRRIACGPTHELKRRVKEGEDADLEHVFLSIVRELGG